jgi:hypothetical protein
VIYAFADVLLGLPWLDDKQASLQLGTTLVFTLMDGTTIEYPNSQTPPGISLNVISQGSEAHV